MWFVYYKILKVPTKGLEIECVTFKLVEEEEIKKT